MLLVLIGIEICFGSSLLIFIFSCYAPILDLKMVSIEKYGVKCMSMGFLVEKDAPILWRGPMAGPFIFSDIN